MKAMPDSEDTQNDLLKPDASHHRYEYQTINNQRMNVSRFVQLWNTISFPGAAAIYFAALKIGTDNDLLVLVALAPFAATAFMLYASHIQKKYDGRILDLYPRTLVLEYILSFKYFRNYMLTFDEPYPDYVKTLDGYFGEKVNGAGDLDEFWNFALEEFKKRRRKLLRTRKISIAAGNYVRDVCVGIVLAAISAAVILNDRIPSYLDNVLPFPAASSSHTNPQAVVGSGASNTSVSQPVLRRSGPVQPHGGPP